jgi:Asp-tRNA(Asn)/Glu-tRNA(Gln) amidotransferase A subunit family amidase
MISAEMAVEHANWYARYAERYRQRTAEIITDGQKISNAEVEEIRLGRNELRCRLENQMKESGIDLWVSPAAPGPAPWGIEKTGDPLMNLPWTYTGMPSLTLPAGKINDLPLGMQMIAPFMADEILTAWVKSLSTLLH